jgi:hypothetical protein
MSRTDLSFQTVGSGHVSAGLAAADHPRNHGSAMKIIEILIDMAVGWLRDLVLGVIGRRAEELVTDYVRRRVGKRTPDRRRKRRAGRSRKDMHRMVRKSGQSIPKSSTTLPSARYGKPGVGVGSAVHNGQTPL